MILLLRYFWPLFALSTVYAQSRTVDFLGEVKPILEKNCVGCHNAKLRMSGLSLATREHAVSGGRRGAALGSALTEGELLKAIRHDSNLKMPPGRKLADAEIGVLERWVGAGAPWPENAVDSKGARPNHWSFLAPQRPAIPRVRRQGWAQGPVDAFLLARLEKEELQPSPAAPPATLVRRLYLDLIGLPPTPAQTAKFLADARPRAWEHLVDELLASPHFGERWGRRWLDYARYADSDGGSRDEPRMIWRYRDWVIEALNRDMPFDRFVVDQLAGDLVEKPTADQLIATGFHRNSPLQIEAGTDREQYRVEMVFDRVDTTGTVLLGLSAGCAKCHDHKFDPISQREYYQMFAVFNNTDDYSEQRPRFNLRVLNLYDVHGPYLNFAPPEAVALREDLTRRLLALDDETEVLRALKTAEAKEQIARIEAEMAALRKQVPVIDGTMITRELAVPRESFLLKGADYLSKGEPVRPGTPSVLHPYTSSKPVNRLEFARWLVSPANPLLARVTVNRIWQEYFGRGIVETENDFGTQGSPPTHPQLLDWLATEFIGSGWSQKAIHRAIVTSAAYRQSSDTPAALAERDPLNLLLARQSRLRLDAEVIRDIALAASGKLSPKIGGPSAFPPQPSSVKKSWRPSVGEERYRRGLYTFFWRVTPNPHLVVFDAPSAMTTCTRRQRSNTPLQALTLMNESTFHELAQGLAGRIIAEAPPTMPGQLQYGFRLVLGRDPSPGESVRFARFLAAERDALLTKPEDAEALAPQVMRNGRSAVDVAMWVAVARVLLNTDEFMTRE